MTIEQQAVAFLGFGEAAMAFVKGWDTHRPATIKAFDIKTNDPDVTVRDAKNADYQKLNVLGAVSAAVAMTDTSAVFSLVTADQAALVAENAAASFPKGAFFFDCNSCAPGTKRRNAEKIEAAGGRYVDVAVMAPVYPKLHKTPLLLSGPHAEAGLAYLADLDMAPAIVQGDIGAGSSIKMIRSIMMKGMEALFAECVLAGRKAGVEEAVLASLDKTYPGFDFPAKAGYMLERSMTHGIRRAAEMEEVALTVHELGLANEMAKATVQWQRRIGTLKLDAGELEYQDRADMILKALQD
ncbi:DUF1932 domain-containing protein [Thalassospira sp.]|uniref:NAD(P)-dependent oxidoreductase n=1 Tax=Thalassospira sp. TaxID=1912094 RepID=UPI003AA85046